MMKKIFALVLLLVLGKLSYSQYPLQQNLGSDSTIVISKGALQSRLINVTFTDTTQANTQRIRQYPGAQIATTIGGINLWVRNATATAWVPVAVGSGNNIYTIDGTLTGNRTLSGGGNSLTFTGLSQFLLSVGNQTFTVKSDSATLTKRLSYTTNLGSTFKMYSLVDKNYVDSSITASPAGTVTQVNTNNGSGITGGPITSTGTLAIDTLLISTRAWRQKGVDSLQANINLKLNIVDTTGMLANYFRTAGVGLKSSGQTVYADTLLLSTRAWRQKGVDSVAALINNNVSGTPNYVSKFTGTHTIGNSQIYDNGTAVGINTTSPTARLDIKDTSGIALNVNERTSTTANVALNVKSVGNRGFAALIDQADSSATGTQYNTIFRKSMMPGTGNPAPGAGVSWYTQLGNDNDVYRALSVYRARAIDTTGFSSSSVKGSSTEFWTRKNNVWDTTLVLNQGNVGIGTGQNGIDSALTVAQGAYIGRGIRAPGLPNAAGTKALRIDASGNISYADTLIDAGGTVTSVATNNGTGITGGTITTTGTLAIDTLLISTRAWRQKGIDSVANLPRVTSVGLTMPAAFNVSGSPVTGSGTLAVTAAGNATQYIRGDGVLALFPGGGGGGGGGKIYYLNGGVSLGTYAGITMYELGDTAVIGSAANFTRATTGNIANFITDVNKPGLLQIPSGVWTVDAYLSETGGGSNHAELYAVLEIWNGTTLSTVATSPALQITEGTFPTSYSFDISVPTTNISVTDRIVIQFYIQNTNGKTVTLYTQNGYVGEVHTTFTTGIGSLNGLTAPSQYFATGTSGTDFNISSVTETHTFNLPVASATNTGKLSSTDWSTFNNKVGGSGTTNYLPKFTGTSTIGNSGLQTDANGNLGIGTSLSNWNVGYKAIQSNSTLIISSTTESDLGNNFYIDGTNNAYYLQNGGATIYQQYGSNHRWVTAPSGTAGNVATFTERMLLTPTGLGIGTSPDSLLTVNLGTNLKRGVRMSGLPQAPGTKALRINAAGTISYADTLIDAGGTVTSVATNNGTGITGGTITTTGTLAIDTLLISTRAWRQKGIDSVAALANGKINGSLISGYLTKATGSLTIDTSQLYQSSGLIGIGTTSPAQKLDINGDVLINGLRAGRGSGDINTNAVLGRLAFNANTTGFQNVAIGNLALYSNTSGANNVAIGNSALSASTTGNNNISIGHNSMLNNTTGFQNVAVGIQSLNANTTGESNTAIGTGALASITTGYYNAAIGLSSGRYITSGANNTTSSESVYLGYDTRASANGNTNEIVIGGSAQGNGSNSVTLGNSSITKTILRSNVGIGTVTPDSALQVVNGAYFQRGIRASGLPTAPGTKALRINAAGTISIADTLIDAGGTVTSVATNNGTGITGGTITTTGTLAIDTLLISTRAWRQKGIDSVAALINSNISGTTNYVAKFTGTNTIGNSQLFDNGTNVGIGTTSPTSRLQSNNSSTYNSSTPSGAIIASNLSAGNAVIDIGVDGNYLSYIQSRNVTNTTYYNLLLNPNGGNVGIGITSPQANLVVQNTSGTSIPSLGSQGGHFQLQNGTYGLLAGVAGSGNVWMQVQRTDGTATAYNLLLQPSGGNVGIGTSSPAQKLDVIDSGTPTTASAGTVARFVAAGGSGFDALIGIVGGNGGRSMIDLGDTDASSVGRLGYDHTTNFMFFQTNGSERARITSGGNLLVGTTTDAGYKLYVNGTGYFAGTTTIYSSATNSAGLIVRGGSSVGVASSASGQILIGQTPTYRGSIAYDDNTGYMYIDNLYDNANSNIYFRTRTVGTPVNAMTILGAGNVGIGTTSPDSLLTVQTGAWVKRGLRLSGLPSAPGTRSLRIDANGTVSIADTLTNGISGSGTTNYIPKFTSSSAIGNSNLYDASGSILIGKTSSDVNNWLLQLYSTSGTQSGVQLTYGGVGSAGIWENSSGALVFGNDGASGTTERMRLTSGGSLGIGTSAPGSARLSVSQSADNLIGLNVANPTGRIGVFGYSAAYQLDIGSATNDDISIGNFAAGSGVLKFLTNNTERMRLDASGNLLLGQTSSAYSSAGRGLISINGTSEAFVGFNTGGNYKGYLGHNGTDFTLENQVTSGALKFVTNGSTRMTLDASGNLGLGVTPSAWSVVTALQIKQASVSADQSSNITSIINNGYYDGSGNKYIQNGASAIYQQFGGQHIWYNAPSGTAGNAISFTQAMTLDASGNLGIGSTSPSNRLQITAAAGSSHARWTESATTVGFVGGAQGIITGLNGSFAVRGESGLVLSGAGNAANLYINSSGNVGIGTTSPGNKLTVNGDIAILAGNGMYFNNSVNTANSSIVCPGGGSMSLRSYGAEMIGLSENATLVFSTNSSERMRITSGGNVLVGTTTDAGYKLNVNGSIASNTATGEAQVFASNSTSSIYFFNSYAGNAFGIYDGTAGQHRILYDRGNNYLALYTGASERMRINSSGNVGIGTTSPGTKLEVYGSGLISSKVTSTDNQANLYLQGTFGQLENLAGDFYITNNAASSPLIFRTATTERMRITSGGNVLIGSSSDGGYKLQVEGTIRANNGQLLAITSGNYLQSTRTSTNAQFQTWYDSDGTTRRGYFGYGSGGSNDFTLMNETTNGILIFGSNNAERMRLNAGGELLINTTSDAGDYKLQVNGNGYFSNSVAGLVVKATNTGASSYLRLESATIADLWFGRENSSGTSFGLPANSSTIFSEGAYPFSLYVNGSTRLTITSSGNTELTGSIKTAAPSGGTAKPYKWGEAGVAIGGSNGYAVKVEIDGTLYYLMTGYLPEPAPEAAPNAGPAQVVSTRFEEPVMKIKTDSQRVKDLEKEVAELKEMIKGLIKK